LSFDSTASVSPYPLPFCSLPALFAAISSFIIHPSSLASASRLPTLHPPRYECPPL
jgi:hypothetical protein